MTSGNKGLLIGTLVGVVVAATNWDGDRVGAAWLIVKCAAIGFAIGYFVGKRRSS